MGTGSVVRKRPLKGPNRIVRIVDGPAKVEVHLSDGQLVGDRPCIGKGAGQSIEFGNHKSVTLTASGQSLTQPGPFAIGSRQAMINIDPVGSHPERSKAVALGSEVLLISGHSGVSDE
jgi:hypothetical protein